VHVTQSIRESTCLEICNFFHRYEVFYALLTLPQKNRTQSVIRTSTLSLGIGSTDDPSLHGMNGFDNIVPVRLSMRDRWHTVQALRKRLVQYIVQVFAPILPSLLPDGIVEIGRDVRRCHEMLNIILMWISYCGMFAMPWRPLGGIWQYEFIRDIFAWKNAK
jgi:hypothetical protein